MTISLPQSAVLLRQPTVLHFLCYVTPAEHLRLPDLEDVKEGIIASRIAAHAADIAKGVPGARDIDNKMSDARRRVCWDEMFQYAIEPEKRQ